MSINPGATTKSEASITFALVASNPSSGTILSPKIKISLLESSLYKGSITRPPLITIRLNSVILVDLPNYPLEVHLKAPFVLQLHS